MRLIIVGAAMALLLASCGKSPEQKAVSQKQGEFSEFCAKEIAGVVNAHLGGFLNGKTPEQATEECIANKQKEEAEQKIEAARLKYEQSHIEQRTNR